MKNKQAKDEANSRPELGTELTQAEGPVPAGTPIATALGEQTERGARLRESWRHSPERRKLVIAAGIILVTALIGAAVAALIVYKAAPNDEEAGFKATTAAIIIFGVFGYVGLVPGFLYRRQQRRAWYDREVVLRAHTELSRVEMEVGSKELDLPSLWSLTQKRLDYYHGLATSQSEKSFSYGLIAAGVGLLVIIASGVAAAFAHSTAASVSAVFVGLGGGGLVAYIGGTFMRMQENAAGQLREYFSQPLEFSRFLAAERLLNQLDERTRAVATHELISSLAGGPVMRSETDQEPNGQPSENKRRRTGLLFAFPRHARH